MGKEIDKTKKTDIYVYIGYGVTLAILLLMLIYMAFSIKDTVFSARLDEMFNIIEPDSFTTVQSVDAPTGAYNECHIKLANVVAHDSSLIFHTSHTAVDVYIDNDLLYSVHPDKNNAFSRTVGGNWVDIPIYTTDGGRTLKIILTPIYPNKLDICPEFYYGSTHAIWLHLILPVLPTFIMAVFAMLVGFAFIIYSLINIKNVDRSLIMIGMFSVFIGIWKITDLSTVSLIFPANITIAYLPYFSLMLVVIPFVMFLKGMFTDKGNVLWYIPCFANIGVVLIMVTLQLIGVADLRETLWMLHTVMLAIIPITIYMIVREIKDHGAGRKLKVTLLCMGICLFGLFVDIVTYYATSGSRVSFTGILCFLIYIIVLGVFSLQSAWHLMNKGRQAERFEKMAYHDQLTGLYNRTAYADYTGQENFSPKKHIVVMFDLNNLKKCNDTMGHEQGDSYIINSARIIEKYFGALGTCYRMGGDEFCALLKNVSVEKCTECVKNFKAALEEYNTANPDAFPIRIACGYELYDAEEDYDIGDTLRRADKMMYNEKFAMKQANNEEVR